VAGIKILSFRPKFLILFEAPWSESGDSSTRAQKPTTGDQRRRAVPPRVTGPDLAWDAPFGYQRRLPSRLAHGMPGRLFMLEDGACPRREMPKLKTKSGAKKRFKLTASGRIKAGVAGKRHRLISHNGKYIRQQRGTKVMSESDSKTIKAYFPYGG
jgi:large subunit ribosomal protein L35